jgi:hypothetical protein
VTTWTKLEDTLLSEIRQVPHDVTSVESKVVESIQAERRAVASGWGRGTEPCWSKGAEGSSRGLQLTVGTVKNVNHALESC